MGECGLEFQLWLTSLYMRVNVLAKIHIHDDIWALKIMLLPCAHIEVEFYERDFCWRSWCHKFWIEMENFCHKNELSNNNAHFLFALMNFFEWTKDIFRSLISLSWVGEGGGGGWKIVNVKDVVVLYDLRKTTHIEKYFLTAIIEAYRSSNE